jgi:uncharacterized membrane protein
MLSIMAFLPPTLPRKIAVFVVAAFFCFVGVGHFTNTDFFLAIVPPYLPAPLALVYISGVFEILGGLGVLHPASRRRAGFGLLALLFAVFPANLHMALNPAEFPDITATALYGRLPLQFVFAAVVWWAACSPGSQSGTPADSQSGSPTHPPTHSPKEPPTNSPTL